MKKSSVTAFVLLACFAAGFLACALHTDQEWSFSERRRLAQKPTVSTESLMSGKFMSDFESYSLDQFPLRDTFREAKSLFHRFVLRQSDKSGIYISQGYAAAQEYPLSEA